MLVTAPKRTPNEFGFKNGDHHIVVNAATKIAKFYGFDGRLLYDADCRAQGMNPDWHVNQGDTPPGLYKLGLVYADYEAAGTNPSFDRTLRSFGWYSIDMVDLEGNEDGNGRAGLMLHGGGTACGWPGAWAPYQELYDTYGCLRMHNKSIRDKVIPLLRKGTVFVSVHQDDA